MSDAEAVMWAVESDPVLRSDFMNITVLEGPPDPRLLRRGVEAALDAYPPLRQRVERPPFGIAPPVWVDEDDFDLDYHIRRVAVPPPGTDRQLFDLASAFAAPPLDRARPLWEVTVVESLNGGRAAVLQRVHHTLTDGMGGVALLRCLFSPGPERAGGRAAPGRARRDTGLDAGGPAAGDRSPGGDEPEWPWPRAAAAASAFGYRFGQGLCAARRSMEVASNLWAATGDELREAANRAGRTARSVADQVVVAGGSLSPVMTGRSLARRFEATQLDLEALRGAGRALGVSRNATFVAGVAGALGAYHERMGGPCDALRMAVPLSARTGLGPVGGNRFVPARAVVPVSHKDPARALAAAQQTLNGLLTEPGRVLAEHLAGIVSLVPPAVLVPALRAQAATVDFAASIVPGLRSERFLGGARVEASYPMGPRLGCAVNFTLLSCGEGLNLGVNLDPAAVTDAAELMDCIAESFGSLAPAR